MVLLRVSGMYLVKQFVEEIFGVPNGDGSNPEWGRTGYFVERIIDFFESG